MNAERGDPAMFYYPINLNLAGKSCAVVGGGKVARRKVGALLGAGALVTVVSPALLDSLAVLAGRKEILHLNKAYAPGDLAGFFLVVCAAPSGEVNRRAAIEAKENGALVLVADGSYPSDFTVPAVIRRGDFVITVSTNGKSPALSRQVKRALESEYGEEYGAFLQIVEKIRAQMKNALESCDERAAFWEKALQESALALVKQGKLNEAEAEIRNAIGSAGIKS